MDLRHLPRQLDAIGYAAAKLGYRTAEVEPRLNALSGAATCLNDAAAVREIAIQMRGQLPWHLVATATFLDLQLERLIDMLSTDEQLAELDAIAARVRAAMTA